MQELNLEHGPQRGLGEEFDLLVIDEAQEYTDDQASALKYVVTDSRNPQTIFCGTPHVEEKVMNIFRETVRKDDYDAVFSVLEYMAREFYELSQHRLKMQKYYNALFEKEYVGYRFVDWKIVAITDENEIAAIEEGISGPYDVVNIHISKAITLLSDRDKPDYENSIKESISAVEALCEVITGVKGKEATLSKLLKKLEEDGVVIHSAMKSL